MNETYSKTFATLDIIRRRILTGAAESFCFGPMRREKEPGKGWTDDFCLSNAMGKFSRADHDERAKSNKHMLDSAHLDLHEMSLQELDDLGFSRWDESGFRLVPIWVMPFLPPEMALKDFNGEDGTVGEADLDHRGGLTAYGFMPTKGA